MAYDYDKLYAETPQALGPPSPILVDFFDRLELRRARVLDVGCGQGRDTLFIARQGHAVVGVDMSPNGIRRLLADAESEKLAVDGVVADITAYTPPGDFDVILIDRTLHMLPRSTRHTVLASLLGHVAENGWLLIADEPANIAEFEAVIAAHAANWKTVDRQRAHLFVRRFPAL